MDWILCFCDAYVDLRADLYIDENKLILLHTIVLLSFCRSSMYNVSAGSTWGSDAR